MILECFFYAALGCVQLGLCKRLQLRMYCAVIRGILLKLPFVDKNTGLSSECD